ncbi:MAG: class I SAM-dependent methyltransferase [Eubacteriales bacterium]|nr:class I SAM-dependent methyltransferase [Eubacteriales bacterium]
MKNSQITQWCHQIILSQARREGLYIDATMGKGNDTLFLCQLAGDGGRVLAFDIQEKALECTEELLKKHHMSGRAELILDGHENMARYAKAESVDLICFNFGYLPGGDHQIATRPETSVRAVEEGLALLKPGGMMSLCIYSGGDTGFEEKEQILEYLKELPFVKYNVIVNEYYNRGNHPPMPVFIWKG